MEETWENELTNLSNLELEARSTEVVTWQGRQALRLGLDAQGDGCGTALVSRDQRSRKTVLIWRTVCMALY